MYHCPHPMMDQCFSSLSSHLLMLGLRLLPWIFTFQSRGKGTRGGKEEKEKEVKDYP